MPENNTPSAYHLHHCDQDYWTDTPAPAQPANRGRFQKGHDPRRHKFTREECQRGFWAAIESVVNRYPNAVNARGHIALNLIPAMNARRQLAAL